MGESAAEKKILFLPVKDKRDNFRSRCWIWIFVHEFSSFSSLLLATFVLSNIEILFKNICLLRISFEYCISEKDFQICQFLSARCDKYSEHCQTFNMKLFAKIVNEFQPLITFAKKFYLIYLTEI